MQEASSYTKIASALIPCLGPIPEDSTENLVAIPKELRMLIFSHLNASSRELSANVCRTWRAEVIHLELIQFRKWVDSLAEILKDDSLDHLRSQLNLPMAKARGFRTGLTHTSRGSFRAQQGEC